MTAARSVIVVVLLVGGLTVAPVASAFVNGFPHDTGANANVDAPESDERPPMGVEISSFMQASAANANESIDAKLFIAAFENGDNDTRERIVTERTDRLERKLATLEAEHDRLTDTDVDGEMNQSKYRARLTGLTVRIAALHDAIDEVEPRASAVGVDVSALGELRTHASDLSGPEIAAMATDLAGVDPPRGPPEDVLGGENGPNNSNNTASGGPGGNGQNDESTNRGNRDPNRTEQNKTGGPSNGDAPDETLP